MARSRCLAGSPCGQQPPTPAEFLWQRPRHSGARGKEKRPPPARSAGTLNRLLLPISPHKKRLGQLLPAGLAHTCPRSYPPPEAPERELPRSPTRLPMAGSRRLGGVGVQRLSQPCLGELGGKRGQQRRLTHWRALLASGGYGAARGAEMAPPACTARGAPGAIRLSPARPAAGQAWWSAAPRPAAGAHDAR